MSEEAMSSETLHSTAAGNEQSDEQIFPDWQLIGLLDDSFEDSAHTDEISIKLLEQGIGTFDTLQKALPSVALAQIEQIKSDECRASMENEMPGKGSCTDGQMLKLFRLAQLQIEYLLKTQQSLVQRVTKAEERAKRLKKENWALREQFCRGPPDTGATMEGTIPEGPQWGRELFRCMECNKIFLHANFLAEHIQRRHGGQLESAARLSSVKSKAGRVLGLGEQPAEVSSNKQPERMRSVKRKGPPQRGQSHGSGTFRKRNDARSATGIFLGRQQSQSPQQKDSSCPSSSIREEIIPARTAGRANRDGDRRTTLTLSAGEESSAATSHAWMS